MPMPQLGWHPQESWPHSAFGPCTRSAQSEKVDMNEIGNQSRSGTPKAHLVLDVVRHVREGIALERSGARR